MVRLRQTAIKLRRFITPQRETIVALAGLEGWNLAPEELALLRESSNRTRRIMEELDVPRDRFSALQNHFVADRAYDIARAHFWHLYLCCSDRHDRWPDDTGQGLDQRLLFLCPRDGLLPRSCQH